MSYGRAAVGRADGRVVFVEGGAPGDELEFAVHKSHERYDEADLVRVIEAGSSRVTPPCPIVDRCGGCPWQHLAGEAQLQAKRSAVVENLRRIAGLNDPPVEDTIPSPVATGYRNRLRLRFDRGKLGFYQARTHSLVEVSDCLIAEQRVRDALGPATRFAASLETRVTRVEIASRGELDGVTLAINSAGRLRHSDAERIRHFVDDEKSDVRGVHIWGRGWKRRRGELGRVFVVDGEGTWIGPDTASFAQVNSSANRVLVETVLAEATREGAERAVELYAGAGNLSLPLARRLRGVVAVESDETAAKAASAAARAQRIDGLRMRAATTESFLAEGKFGTPDVVVCDPPRSGLGAANSRLLAAQGVRRIVYVSCDAATLARDVAVFTEHGYRLARATPIDLFPHSFHVETVCSLELT